ncbi:MAG TPA: MFS transporter [Tepidisphaeraceae bacterium]|jgi:SHS family lactate transporter-like MFS transporter
MPNAELNHDSLRHRDASFALMAGFLGWTLDAFDYFLVVVSLPAIAKDFHVKSTAEIGLALTLTLMFRPLGALIFGLLADRYGRRMPMMIDLVFYSVVEVATAFAPNLTVFLILRALFGIGMGGEWGVGASLVMEKISPRWRGLLSGFLQEGYAFGYLLAAIAAYFCLDRFGWRNMFLLGGLPAVLALVIRFFVRESEVWEKNKAESWKNLTSAISSHWKLWLYLTLLMAMMNFSSHGTQDMYPTFMKEFRGLNTKTYNVIVMIMNVGAIIGGILFGIASDRVGRRKMMALALFGALLVIPLWAFSTTLATIAAGGFLMQFMVQGAWGIVPAHINELSPDSVRGFLPGFSYQCGNLIAASIPYIEPRLASHYPFPRVMAMCSGIIFFIGIVVISKGPERKGIVFGTDKN